jgi:uncharacterized cupredoxin-like copper-binding protein
MRIRTLLTPAVLGGAIAAFVVSSGVAATKSAHTTLHLSAKPGIVFKFNTSALTAKAGTVTILMSNPSGSRVKHGIGVSGKGVDKDGKIVTPGKTSSLTVALKPGRYTFYCNNDNHRGLGMRGVLTVK